MLGVQLADFLTRCFSHPQGKSEEWMTRASTILVSILQNTRPVGRGVQGGACAPPFQTEIYKQQYAKWYLQDSHQLNLMSLATH